MRLNRKIMIRATALAAIGLGAVSTADAQVCRHIGRWTRTADGIRCLGDYVSGDCLWYDDCRKSVE
jgi:hypothetical protein